MKKLTCLFTAVFIVLTFASCSGEAAENDKIIQTDITETIGETASEFEYGFPEADYGGAEFIVLNTDSEVWGAFSDIVIEDAIGEVLNDAVYNRNSQIQEIFNITISQTAIHPSEVIGKARTLIQAGDDTYDAMFVSHGWEGAIGTIATEGGLYNLAEIPELQLDMQWWNQNIIEQLKISKSSSLYFALNDIDVYNMQSSVILFFNEKILEDLSLDKPYNLVREGKWTLDVLNDYLKAGANLNGDESWKWSTGGNCVFGLASYHMGATAMLLGTDVKIIDFDNDNIPYFAAENEHFYNAVQKLSSILSVEGQNIYENLGGSHRITDVFANGRTLFTDGSMSNAELLRAMEEPFGILPMPKYDENQNEYRTTIHPMSTFTIIPVTNANPDQTAYILDAMAYLSYKDVRPAYFDTALSLKQLRNDDSIDMLNIILNTRSLHIGYVYGWTTSFMNNDMRLAIQKSEPDAASLLAKNEQIIRTNIDKTLEFFNE